MRNILENILGGIIATILCGVAVILWNELFYPLWETSPSAFVCFCIIDLLIGAGIACSSTMITLKHKQTKQLKAREEENAKAKEAATKAVDHITELERVVDAIYDKKTLILSLPDKQKKILHDIIKNGPLTTYKNVADGSALCKKGLLVKLESPSPLQASWDIANDVAQLVTVVDTEIMKDLEVATERQNKIEKKERLDQEQKSFLSLDYPQRMFVYGIFRKGGETICDSELENSEYDSGFLTFQNAGRSKAKCSIAQKYLELFSERQAECFSDLEEELQQMKENNWNG